MCACERDDRGLNTERRIAEVVSSHRNGVRSSIVAEYWGLTAGMATLAVFARSPMTLAGAQGELSAWPGARWPRNAAHKHVPALVGKGLLRRTSEGNVTALDWFEITPEGHDQRVQWLRSHAIGPAAVERDTALGKIELCMSLADVALVIEGLQVEQAMYERAYGEAHGRSAAERVARARDPDRPYDLRSRLRDIGIVMEAALWDETAKRLHLARRELETMRAELQREQHE